MTPCPSCGGPTMSVPSTGLTSCLAALEFKPCRWHVRDQPWDESVKRRTTMTIKEKRLLAEQQEVDRRISGNR